MKTRLILVGGFLGAGKTTLLAEAAKRLSAGGNRVGLITNDQAPELVDTKFLADAGANVSEVSGSCFCCNFPGLLSAMTQLRNTAHADILIAEPVGSCTDLSATIIQPLKEKHHGEVILSPLSVLADPQRLGDILEGGMGGLHPSAAYIFRKQLEEADLIVVTKADLLSNAEKNKLLARTSQAFPLASVISVSSQTGEGFEGWLASVLSDGASGKQLIEVDYDIYAEGEAVLGWLNATFSLRSSDPMWRSFVEDLLNQLSRRFDDLAASVGHVKLLLTDGQHSLVGNLTGSAGTLSIRGTSPTSSEVLLTVNARVEMSPDSVEAIVREALNSVIGEQATFETIACRCLSPGRPTPTYRYQHLVSIA